MCIERHRWKLGRLVCLGLLFLLLLPTLGRAQEKLWSGLLVGSAEPSSDSDPRLQRYQRRLSAIFGYPYFRLIGQSKLDLSADAEQWLSPGEGFKMRCFVTPARREGLYKVSLQLFHNEKELVQTDARLSQGSPLFIRGPLYGRGQLIIVVMVRN